MSDSNENQVDRCAHYVIWIACTTLLMAIGYGVLTYGPPTDEGAACRNLDCITKQYKNISRVVNTNRHMFVGGYNAKRYKRLVDDDTRKLWEPMLADAASNTKRLIHHTPQYQRCVIVGNSSKLSGGGHGSEIDAYDAVFRMTFAKIKGYEVDVGKRTTYRLQWSHSSSPDLKEPIYLFYQHNTPGNFPHFFSNWISLLSAFYQKLPRAEIVAYKEKKGAVFNGRPPKGHFLLIDNAFIEDVKRQWSGGGNYGFLNSGEMAIAIALHMCQEVHVYGFTSKVGDPLCYYYDRGPHTCRLKARPDIFKKQIKLLTKLTDLGLITVHE